MPCCVQTLEIRGGCFAMPLSALAEALPAPGSLTRLQLSHGARLGVTKDAAAELSRLTALCELELRCSGMGSSVSQGNQRLEVDLGGFAALPHLSSLQLCDSWLPRLSTGDPPLPALRRLDAGALRWGNPAASAALAALTRLELCAADSAAQVVPGAALAQLTSLQHLELSGCELEGGEDLEEGQPWPGFTSALTCLSLHHFGADDEQMVLPPTLSALRHLSIESEVVRIVIPPLATMPALTCLELGCAAGASAVQ